MNFGAIQCEIFGPRKGSINCRSCDYLPTLYSGTSKWLAEMQVRFSKSPFLKYLSIITDQTLMSPTYLRYLPEVGELMMVFDHVVDLVP